MSYRAMRSDLVVDLGRRTVELGGGGNEGWRGDPGRHRRGHRTGGRLAAVRKHLGDADCFMVTHGDGSRISTSGRWCASTASMAGPALACAQIDTFLEAM